jgi:purine-binding chemotaxis protein CheW
MPDSADIHDDSNKGKQNVTAVARELAGKYLTFRLLDGEYGLPIARVCEVTDTPDITRVPRTCDYIRGVTYLRRKVIPVVDLHLKLALLGTRATAQTALIAVQRIAASGSETMGILVDEVLDIVEIPSERLELIPRLHLNANEGDFILGVGKADGRAVWLLDIERLLS